MMFIRLDAYFGSCPEKRSSFAPKKLKVGPAMEPPIGPFDFTVRLADGEWARPSSISFNWFKPHTTLVTPLLP